MKNLMVVQQLRIAGLEFHRQMKRGVICEVVHQVECFDDFGVCGGAVSERALELVLEGLEVGLKRFEQGGHRRLHVRRADPAETRERILLQQRVRLCDGHARGAAAAQVAELMEHEALRGVDAKLVEQILNEIVDRSPGVTWDAIAGLGFAKQSVREITVLPLLRPDIFRGARQPPKGLLLFGPPGTGKTLIAKVH